MSGAGPSQGPAHTIEYVNNYRVNCKSLLHAGHKYHKLRENKNSTVWTCEKRKKIIKCSGSVTVDKSDVIIKQVKHSALCVPNFTDNEVSVAISRCREEVCHNFIPIQKIFEKHMKDLKNKGYHLLGSVPNYKDIKSQLYRHRLKALNVVKTNFTDATEVVIPEQFEIFVLQNYCESGNRIIILASTEIAEHIKYVSHFFGDGTFKNCSRPFLQLYVIHGDIGSTDTTTNVAPMFYVLLTNKERTTYQKMFELIKEALPQWIARKFTFDFETGAIDAIQTVFPNIDINGCFQHFQRNVFKKAKSLKLTDHEETEHHVKLCMSLGLLPKEDIEDGWLYIMENSYNDTNVTAFNDYFVNQWMEYPDLLWCCHNERHRTTNLAESWNGRFNKNIGANPSFLMLLQTIANDISTYDIKIANFRIKSKSINYRKKTSIDADKKIKELTEAYILKTISIDCFLVNIARTMNTSKFL